MHLISVNLCWCSKKSLHFSACQVFLLRLSSREHWVPTTMHSPMSILVEHWVNLKKVRWIWCGQHKISTHAHMLSTDPPVSSGPLTTLVFAKPLHWKADRTRKEKRDRVGNRSHLLEDLNSYKSKKWCTLTNKAYFCVHHWNCKQIEFSASNYPSFTTWIKLSTKITHHGLG